METPKIFESEYRFCKLVWKHEPIKSGALSKLCAEELGWKNSTTYTVIKRLSERGRKLYGDFSGKREGSPGSGNGGAFEKQV